MQRNWNKVLLVLMLNRRQIRIKVLQSLYAHNQSDSQDLVATEKQLLNNVEGLYDLYLHILSLIIEIADFAENRLEAGKQKLLPTDKDLNPNTRFVDNRFVQILQGNRDLGQQIKQLHINWKDNEDLVRKIYIDFSESESYAKYMDNPSQTSKVDKEIVNVLINEHFIYHDLLPSYFEEMSSQWSEDYYIALALVINTIKSMNESWDEYTKLPPLFKRDPDDYVGPNQDRKFTVDLLRKAIIHSGRFDKMIDEKAVNWEFDRIAIMDLVLLRMGLTEVFEFPTIPLKVTLNETIELAKHFSSPKSKVFINGLLDRSIAEGLRDKTIVKEGRGLVG